MSSKASANKALKRAAAAVRLNIAYGDLPHLGRGWIRADVWRLWRERPAWLTAARKKYAAKRDEQTADKRARLAVMLDDGGLTTANLGPDEVIAYAEGAFMYLLTNDVPAQDAEQALALRWPAWFDDDVDVEGWL